jgi:hypothetical protein
MSMPGFTASNSLGPSSFVYNGGVSLAPDQGDVVGPEFLDFIKEAIEKIADGISSGLQSAVNALQNAINNLNSGGGKPPFVCGQWAARFLACSGNSPTFGEAQMLSACISSNPANSIACATITASMYGVLQQGCRENPNGIGQIMGQICGGR